MRWAVMLAAALAAGTSTAWTSGQHPGWGWGPTPQELPPLSGWPPSGWLVVDADAGGALYSRLTNCTLVDACCPAARGARAYDPPELELRVLARAFRLAEYRPRPPAWAP